MTTQNINIENNTGTINFYNSPEKDVTKANDEFENIRIAAVDKYSDPLEAYVEITPWGDMYRVSFLMKNGLIGQVLQRTYLGYKYKKDAKKAFKEISDFMKEIKKISEKDRVHSVLLVPKIWHKLAQIKCDFGDPESEDLKKRFTTEETHGDFMGATPRGLVIHPVEDHFPFHNNILQETSKINLIPMGRGKNGEVIYREYGGMTKTSSKSKKSLNIINKSKNKDLEKFEEINNKWLNKKVFDIYGFCKLLKKKSNNNDNIRLRTALKIRPLIKNSNLDKSLRNNIIDESLNCMGQYILEDLSEMKKIDVEDYDLFIFDADKTIWYGPPAYKMIPPFEFEKDCLIDSTGQTLTLKEGIREILVSLRELGKDLGLISKSEKKGIDYQNQPVILLLREAGLLNLFNEMIVVSHDIPKSAFIPQDSRTIFIDDDIEELEDVKTHTNADVARSEVVIFDKDDILDFYEDLEPLEVIELKENETIDDLEGWIENENEILVPIEENVIIRARIKDEEYLDKKESSYVRAWIEGERNYIPQSEKPPKPKDGKEYELDHIVPKNKGGTDKKENLRWVEKNKHKQKSKDEGSFSDGGEKKVKYEKSKGKEKYKEYQKNCGEAKQEKDRRELGEEGYSKQQSEIAKKRWNKEKK